MEREGGGGIGMGNTCKPLAVSFQCMTKSTTNKKKKKRMAIIKMSTTSECWKGYGEKRTLYTVGGNVSWCSHYKKQYGGYSEN